MAKRQQTKGVCQLCQVIFNKAGMARHLAKCLSSAAQKEPDAAVSRTPSKAVPLFLLQVQGKYNPEYWLYVEMPATATLRNLDQFLRRIWLECCGHLSAFNIGGTHYSVQTSAEAGNAWFAPPWEERKMDVPVGKVLRQGMKFAHEYDFGSTTNLALRMVGERVGTFLQGNVRLLARNEPPQVLCMRCEKKPAAWIDTCQDQAWCCEDCIENAEEEALPVVNSPRAGVCGYTG